MKYSTNFPDPYTIVKCFLNKSILHRSIYSGIHFHGIVIGKSLQRQVFLLVMLLWFPVLYSEDSGSIFAGYGKSLNNNELLFLEEGIREQIPLLPPLALCRTANVV
jgi:hypothetical protein